MENKNVICTLSNDRREDYPTHIFELEESIKQVDSLIRAEIPNETEDKELFEIIKKNMIHGPCGQLNENSPCMHNGKCSTKFLKHFIQ